MSCDAHLRAELAQLLHDALECALDGKPQAQPAREALAALQLWAGGDLPVADAVERLNAYYRTKKGKRP